MVPQIPDEHVFTLFCCAFNFDVPSEGCSFVYQECCIVHVCRRYLVLNLRFSHIPCDLVSNYNCSPVHVWSFCWGIFWRGWCSKALEICVIVCCSCLRGFRCFSDVFFVCIWNTRCSLRFFVLIFLWCYRYRFKAIYYFTVW